ncbi:MAG: glutamine amidotransferase [Steroidobacter sp.]
MPFLYYRKVFELLFTHPFWAYRSGAFAFASAWPRWLLIASILIGAALIALTLQRRRLLGWRKLVSIGALQTMLLALVLCLLWRPVLNVERVRDRENVLALALDASASMSYGEGEQSRLQQAVAALREGALARMEDTFELRLFGFSQTATPLEAVDGAPASGAQTRIGDALTEVLQNAGSAPLAAVVLVSDGAENGASLSEEHLAHIASYGVPVHTVGVGPEKIANDLELERVDVAASAPAGAKISAELSVRHDANATTRLRVYDRDELIAARELKLDSQLGVTTVSVDLPPPEAGAHQLRFTLDPLESERNVVNNTRTRVVNVPVGKRSVLYVEGEPRWEYKFLRRAVDRDRALRVASLVRTTPNKHYRQGVNSPAELIDGFPSTAEELFAYDAVIIGSYEAASLRSEQHRLLKEFVDRRGGSVLMLAGRYGLSAGGWQNVALADTLPVQLPVKQAGSFVQRTAHAQPTAYGVESSIARLDDDARRNADRWKNLPALADWQTLGRLKPGAVVLLEAAAGRNRAPLLAWQHYGRGATFVLGTASTLRWQMHLPPEDQSHETFWRQLLHALAASAPPRAALASERVVYDDERSVTLEAQLRNERFEPIDDADVELRIAPERDPSLVQMMQPSGQGDGRYTATIDAASTGLYRIDMTAKAGGEEIGVAVAHVLRNDGVAEHFAIHQHRDVLERIAAITGGRYWSLDDLDGLAAAIPYSRAGVVERQTLDLWNLPIVFLVLLTLKLAEWLLRLRWGRL